MLKQYIANNLRALREEYKLSNSDVSKLLGLKSRTSISGIELGVISPSVKVLNDIADLFCVSLDWLCGKSTSKYIEEVIYKHEEQNKLSNLYISEKPSLKIRADILFMIKWLAYKSSNSSTERKIKMDEAKTKSYLQVLDKYLSKEYNNLKFK